MSDTIKRIGDVKQRLSEYNAWRRGDDEIPQPNPTQLGDDLDYAVKALTALQEMASGDGLPLDVYRHFYKDFDTAGDKSLPQILQEIIVMLLEKDTNG